MEFGKEVYIQTVGDLKKLLETIPDDLWIDYFDFIGGDTVFVSIQDSASSHGHKAIMLSST